jgi:hypothetical protein
MASKYMKKCSTPVAIKEIQISTLTFYLTPIKMTIINNTNTTSSGEDIGKTTLLHYEWEYKLV